MFVEDGTGQIPNQGSCKWKRIYDVNFKLDIVSMYLLEGGVLINWNLIVILGKRVYLEF